MTDFVRVNNKNNISGKMLWVIRCIFLITFYALMYISKEIFDLTQAYKFFIFLPILFLMFVKHVLQKNKIMVSGSNSLKVAIEICWASGMSAIIFYLVNIYNK